MEPGVNPDESAVPQTETAPEVGSGAPTETEQAATTPVLTPFPGAQVRVWAVLAHLLSIAGYMTSFGLLGWVGPLVIWVKQRNADPFVAFHALQSLFFQLIWTAILFIGARFLWVMPEVFLCWILASTIPVVWCVIAALKAHLGEWYQYPLVGQWALDFTEQTTRENL